MLLNNMYTVGPVWEVLLRLQEAKDRRQGAGKPPADVKLNPDQTVLSDFIVWGFHFFTFLSGLFVKNKAHTTLMVNASLTPAPMQDALKPELDRLVAEFNHSKEYVRGDTRAVLYIHQISVWVTLPQHQGLKCRPWVIDLLYPAKSEIAPHRLGNPQLFGTRPSVTTQIIALLEYFAACKAAGNMLPIPSAVSFETPEETVSAQKVLCVTPIEMGCNTNSQLDIAAGYTSCFAMDANMYEATEDNEILFWQSKAESLAAKGRVDLDYLKMWYDRAASFFRSRPWDSCPEQCVLEVELHGIGRRNVVISGSNGGATAMRLFKPGKAADMSAKHDAVIFTAQCNCPFDDVKIVEQYGLEVANEYAYPNLFQSYQIFKRPPYAELEVYRACFEVIPLFLMNRSLKVDMAANEAEWLQADYKIRVPTETKPIKAEVRFPAVEYRRDPSLELPSVTPVPDVLAKACGPEIIAAFDAALDSFKKNGDTAESRALAGAAATLNTYVYPYMIAQKSLPVYKSWAEENVESASAAKKASRKAQSYCMLSLNGWRATKKAIPWFETQANIANPLPSGLVKCSNVSCLRGGLASMLKNCSACQRAAYCTTKCQRAAWTAHKADCKCWAAENKAKALLASTIV